MAATALGMTVAPWAGWHWVFWAGVLPAVIAIPLIARRLPESPGVLHARGRWEEAAAVVERYRLPRQALEQAPATGARGRLAAFRACSVLSAGGRPVVACRVLRSAPRLRHLHLAAADDARLRYGLTSSISFLLIINAGGIVGMLVAGRLSVRFGAVPVSIVRFALTARRYSPARRRAAVGPCLPRRGRHGGVALQRPGHGLRGRPCRPSRRGTDSGPGPGRRCRPQRRGRGPALVGALAELTRQLGIHRPGPEEPGRRVRHQSRCAGLPNGRAEDPLRGQTGVALGQLGARWISFSAGQRASLALAGPPGSKTRRAPC